MSEAVAIDSNGSPLHVGNVVLYSATGTKGTIMELMSDEEGTWALIDKTNLYYKTEVLTTVKGEGEKEISEREFTVKEIEETLEKQKEFVPTEMDHSNVESGG